MSHGNEVQYADTKKSTLFSGQYLCNRSPLDVGVLGYIGIVWPKEHSPEVWSVPPVTPCILQHSGMTRIKIKFSLNYDTPRSALRIGMLLYDVCGKCLVSAAQLSIVFWAWRSHSVSREWYLNMVDYCEWYLNMGGLWQTVSRSHHIRFTLRQVVSTHLRYQEVIYTHNAWCHILAMLTCIAK